MKKNLKLVFGFITVFFIALTLVACKDSTKEDQKLVDTAKEALVIGYTAPDTKDSVTKNVTLVTKQGEVDVTWATDNPSIISTSGVVVRTNEDEVVTLTATLKKGEAKATKTFDLTVKAEEVVVDPDIAIVDAVKTSLALGFKGEDTKDSVTEDITLKTTENGVNITWVSSVSTVVSTVGKVTRPAAGEPSATVKLTATLKKGAVTETKEFTVVVIAEDYVETGAKQALIAHYEDTLGNPEWLATEDVILITEIEGSDGETYEVQWTVNPDSTDFITNEGVITRPSFTEGNKTVFIKATLSDGEENLFGFTIKSLNQTDKEKVEAALDQVTAGVEIPYQTKNFLTVDKVSIDGKDVAVTWESSDTTLMTDKGELVVFIDDVEFREVSLTAKITLNDITSERVVEFKVLPVKEFASFKDALTTDNFKVVSGKIESERLVVKGVAFHASISGGYYLKSADNMLAFVYGNKPSTLNDKKLYDVMFIIDVFHGTYQIKEVALSNERDGKLPVITPVEVTLDEITKLEKPTNAAPNHHTPYKLKDVKVRVDDPADKYKTFFVSQTLPADTVLSDENSVMVYYLSKIDVIKALDGKNINSIEVINNGYRSNNLVWNVNFVGNAEDIDLSLTDEEIVEVVKTNWETKIPKVIYLNKDLKFVTEEMEATIVWETDDNETITTAGVVTVGTVAKEVTINATITKGEAEATLEVKVDVDPLEVTTIEDFLKIEKGDKKVFKLKGIVSGITGNQTFSFEDETAAIAIRKANVYLDVGYEYTIYATRDEFNGLEQAAFTDAFKGEAKDLPTAKTVTADKFNAKDLEDLQAHLINANNLIVTKVVNNNNGIVLTLESGNNKVDLKWDNRVILTAAAKTHLESIEQGDIINLVAAPLGWFKNPQFGYNSETQIVKVALTDQEKVDLVKETLNLVEETETDLELPTTGLLGVQITWVADPAQHLVEGKLIVPEEGEVTVTLTATFKLGELSATKAYTIKLSAKAEVAEGTLYRTFTFGPYTGNGTGYSEGELKWTEEFGEVKTNKNRVQINKSTYAPHDGLGMLVFAPINTATTAHIEFDFSGENYEGLNKLEFTLSAWNNSKLGDITNLSNPRFIVEVKVGTEWIELDTILLKDVLVFEENISVSVNTTHGSGIYKISYVAEDAKKGNTTQAVGLDNLKIFKA